MAAPSLLKSAIGTVLNGWTALQLAVSHGFGGPLSRDKAEWLVGALEQWMMENPDMYADEVEDFLADVMSCEFETVVDDNSLAEISQKICSYYKLIRQGRDEDVSESIRHLAAAPALDRCTAQSGDNEDEDDDDDDMDDDGGAAQAPRHVEATTQPSSAKSREPRSSEASSMDGDDGGDSSWTVVNRVAKHK